MFTFGTPLLSRQVAVNWDQSVALLNQTLGAVAQQTNGNFRHIIACHEEPEIDAAYRRFVTFLPQTTPIPTELMAMRQDKGSKKRAIATWLREQGGGYLMFLDADDLVRNDLVAHCLTTADPHGYIVTDGYMAYGGSNRIRRLDGDFDDQCGSCAIFNFAPTDLPAHMDDTDNYFSEFHSHRTWAAHAAQAGRPLQPVPFPAVIYLRSPDISISGRFFPEIGWRGFKKFVKRVMKERQATPELRAAFNWRA